MLLEVAATQVMVPNPRDIPGLVELIKKWDFSIIPGVNTLLMRLSTTRNSRTTSSRASK